MVGDSVNAVTRIVYIDMDNTLVDFKSSRRRVPDDVAHKRLIPTHRKDLNRGDFLIDDRPEKRGAGEFQGELAHFGSERFPDWPAVMEYMRQQTAEG